MSLDAAYGDGTMQELHRANADSDYGHGKGDEDAQALQQVPRKPDATSGTPGFSQLPPHPHSAPPPPGRNVVAQFPQAPPPHTGPQQQQPLLPLPVMPGHSRAMPPMQPPPPPMHPHMHPMQQHFKQAPLREDDRFNRIQKKGVKAAASPVYDANGMEIKQKKSFYESYKVVIIVIIVIICLVLGILVAVVVAQKKKTKLAELAGGFDGAGVPQYVGGMDFGNHFSSLPQRAWNESASVYVRR